MLGYTSTSDRQSAPSYYPRKSNISVYCAVEQSLINIKTNKN